MPKSNSSRPLTSSQKKYHRLFLFTVVFVMFIGLLARFVGLYPGHPPNHPDEPILGISFEMLKERTLDPFQFSSYRFQYPGFPLYLYQAISAGVFLPITTLWEFFRHPYSFISHIDQEPILRLFLGPNQLTPLFWYRAITAFLGFLSIPLLYLVGTQLFNRYVGLVAALLLAVNYRHVMSSHLSLVDAPNATITILSLYASVKLLTKPTVRNYIIAGICVGLALSTKLYIFSAIPFFWSHILVSIQKKSGTRWGTAFFNRKVLWGIIAIAGTFFLWNPFLLQHFEVARQQQAINSLRYGFFKEVGLGFPPFWYLFTIGLGQAPSLLFFFGISFGILKRTYHIASSFILPLIFFPAVILLYVSHGSAYSRNFTSMIPFMTLFAALALVELCAIFFTKISKSFFLIIIIVFTLVVSYSQIRNTAILDYWFTKPWSQQCILPFVTDVLSPGVKIARTPGVTLDDERGAILTPYNNKKGNRTPFSLRELQENQQNFLFLNYSMVQGNFINWTAQKPGHWGLPKSEFEESFESLAIKELSRYSVATCIKPWQALDDAYALVAISPLSSLDFLQKVGNFPDTVILKRNDPPVVSERVFVTRLLSVVPGQRYIIRGRIHSSDAISPERRNGFLRVDFYRNDSLDYLSHRGITTAISSRYFGTGAPIQKEVVTIAPREARFMTVSFQVEEYDTDMFVDSLSIFRSNTPTSDEEQRIANAREVDDTTIYPLSIP